MKDGRGVTIISGSTGDTPSPGMCLLAHGGAWDIPDEECEAHKEGMTEALEEGRRMLTSGAGALDVVVEVVARMESHGAFDAGRGSVLTRCGTVEMDAGVMDGATLDFGAVVVMRRVENPIRVALRLLRKGEGQVRLLVAEAADRFAEVEGFEMVENDKLVCARERERFEMLRQRTSQFHTSHAFLSKRLQGPDGTVGCVARDRRGRLAAATSTGGTPYRISGRVGDTPLPGAGYYAHGEAAASATGWGEAIAAVLPCIRSVDDVARGSRPEVALRHWLEVMGSQVRNREGEGATGGLILLDRHGRGAWAYSTPRMARGGWREGADVWVAV